MLPEGWRRVLTPARSCWASHPAARDVIVQAQICESGSTPVRHVSRFSYIEGAIYALLDGGEIGMVFSTASRREEMGWGQPSRGLSPNQHHGIVIEWEGQVENRFITSRIDPKDLP